LAKAVPDSVKPALPGVTVIAPAVIDEEPPLAVLIAESRCVTVSPMPMLVPVLVVPATR